MKVVLDLSRLVEEGKLTPAEAERLRGLAAHDTGSLAINILIGLGVVAVAGGAIALASSALTAVLIGTVTMGIGVGLVFSGWKQWVVLANILVLAGAMMLGGGVVWLGDGAIKAFLIVALVFAAAGIVARSGLLIAGAVLALSSCIGARTGYLHAGYFLGVEEPTITILVFSAVALATYHISKRLRSDYEGLALIAARTSVFLVNFGFWIGSLWGDRFTWVRKAMAPVGSDIVTGRVIHEWQFAIAWALVLVGMGVWAVRANRRWVLTIAAVFGAIHFYTQWFERLGATPASVLIAGLITLAVAIAIWMVRARQTPAPVPT